MTTANVYMRESTDDQVESGAGLGAQLDACSAYCTKMGWELGGPYQEVDGLRGDTPLDKCPALGEAVQALKKGDVLLVYRRDRIARDRMKVAMLEGMLKARKCRLVSTQGEGTEAADPNDPTAFLLRAIVDVFAEFEKLVIRFRTSAALRAKRRRNERAGQVPYGWDLVDDGKRSRPRTVKQKDGTKIVAGNQPIGLVPNAREQFVLSEMRRLRREGPLSYGAIARWLNAEGYRTKTGKLWTTSTVHFLLTRDPHAAAAAPTTSHAG